MVQAGASSTGPLRSVPGEVVRISVPPDPDPTGQNGAATPPAPSPLGREAIAAMVAGTLGRPAPAGLVEQVADLTAGMPWLVQFVVPAIRLGDRGAVLDPVIPSEAIDQLGYELETTRSGVHELLLALCVGFDLSDHLPPAVAQSGDRVDDLVGQARAAGLLLPDGRVVPLVRQAVLATTPRYRVRALQRMLVDAFVESGDPLDPVAESLALDGLRDIRVARTLERAADELLGSEPAHAEVLYQEAAAAGSDELQTAARRAQAAAAAGDLDGAARIVESLLAQENPPDLTRAIDVAAAAWSQRGMLASSADLYRWRGPEKIGNSAGLAIVAMLGTGDLAGAEAMAEALPSPGARPHPGMAATLMGQGVRHSVLGQPAHALPSLIQASDLMTVSAATTPLPELPAALAALAALHSGDLDVADSVLNAALAGGQGGPAARPRIRLLQAWVAMQRDQPQRARDAIGEATAAGGELVPRDLLWLRALEVGLARRADDMPSLVRGWQRARESTLHVGVDLYNLMPIAELLVAATRLRDAERLAPQLADAWCLLEQLGDPPLWSVPLHWAAVQAAILAERPHDLAPHAAALVRASDHDHLASTLATAGRAWVSVLAGSFDVKVVEAAARGLAAVGMTWDGARLAGHASARAPERKDLTRLLACARDLRPSTATAAASPDDRTASAAPVPGGSGEPDGSGMSTREREVALLVLAGKTYQEIGDAIFISPRTVEHHIASIRRRLGVATRAELLAELRVILGRHDPTPG